ncbi:hypothetical protein BH11PAT4_BH11PAT4_2670 [soil metagenome]
MARSESTTWAHLIEKVGESCYYAPVSEISDWNIMATTAGNLQRRKPWLDRIKGFWLSLNPEMERVSACLLVCRAIREDVPITMDRILVICSNGPQEVSELIKEKGCCTISVVDAASIHDESSLQDLLNAYQEGIGRKATSNTLQEDCYTMRFGELTIHHYLCHPKSLKLLEVPNLVLIWRIRDGVALLDQEWVTRLARGSVILSDSTYPLLTEYQEGELSNHPRGGGAACYAANEQFYKGANLQMADNHSLLGILLKK